jgi:hypothetical protein
MIGKNTMSHCSNNITGGDVWERRARHFVSCSRTESVATMESPGHRCFSMKPMVVENMCWKYGGWKDHGENHISLEDHVNNQWWLKIFVDCFFDVNTQATSLHFCETIQAKLTLPGMGHTPPICLARDASINEVLKTSCLANMPAVL